MKILFVSAHLPSPRARQAGQKTSYHMCEWFARCHTVHLLSFATEGELATFSSEDNQIFDSWNIFPVTRWTRLRGALTNPHLPLSVAARASGNFRREVGCLLRMRRFDVAILDHTAMWQYAEQLSAAPIRVGSAHDVLSQLWQRKVQSYDGSFLRPLVKIEQARVHKWEKSSLSRLNFLAPHCEKDGELLHQMNPFACVCPIRPWFTARANAFPDAREPGNIVFFGAFDRGENRDAVEYAVRQILPLVRDKYPRFKFYIAGNHSEKLSRLIGGLSDVVLTGFIEDVPQFLSRMQIALLPLRTGAGVKIKTLECMAAGLSVVTTPVGAEGIGGENGMHYILGSTPRELADQTVRLLKEPSISQSVGERARKFVFDGFDFEKALENLCSLIEDRLVVPKRSLQVLQRARV